MYQLLHIPYYKEKSELWGLQGLLQRFCKTLQYSVVVVCIHTFCSLQTCKCYWDEAQCSAKHCAPGPPISFCQSERPSSVLLRRRVSPMCWALTSDRPFVPNSMVNSVLFRDSAETQQHILISKGRKDFITSSSS